MQITMIRTVYAQLEDHKFLYNRLHISEKQWNKCISVTTGYVEKWQNTANICCGCVRLWTFWTTLVDMALQKMNY